MSMCPIRRSHASQVNISAWRHPRRESGGDGRANMAIKSYVIELVLALPQVRLRWTVSRECK